jgi:hypothetical protein
MGNLIIVATLAIIFSLFTLWLIDSWIKYPFFLLEIFAIIILYLIINNYEIKIRVSFLCNVRLNWKFIVDFVLVLSSATLVLLISRNINGGVMQVLLALLCTSLLPGYVLLNVSGLRQYFSRLESIVLSYILSCIFTVLVVLMLLPIGSNFRTTLILLSYIGLGVVSMLKHKHYFLSSAQKSLAKGIDLFALLLSMGFYILSFYFIYPSFALLPGSDISRHYASSIILWRTPELYSAYQYFLAHLHEAAFINLSNAPLATIQTVLALLNLTMPLAFYAMAKSYTESIDKRLPAVSTIFYSTFSGFAWVYLARLKLDKVQGSVLSLLNMVNDKAYYGAMYIAQPFLWYVPLSLSFTILVVQLMLLKKLDMEKRYFIAAFSLLTVASYMTHITEAVILSLFLSFYAFFSKGKEFRIDDALKASIISFAFLSIFYTVLRYETGVRMLRYGFTGMSFSLTTTLFLPMAILALTYTSRRLTVQDKLIRSLSKLAVKPLITATFYVTSFIYVLGLLVWIAGVPSFNTQMVVDVGLVPWFIYPVFLGILGLLMLISLYCLIQDYEKRALLMPFIALMIFSLVFGKALTFVNVNFFDTGYWEKRFTTYFYLASAVIAPIAVVKFFKSIRLHWTGIKKILVATVIICLVTISGLQSMFIVVEYWNTASAYRPSQEEIDAVNFLANVLENDKYAYTVTLTEYSYNVLDFSAPPYKLTGMQIMYTGENPEMALLSLKAHNLSHAYLYIHKRDYNVLNRYSRSWLNRHLIPMLPIVYRNSEVTIYNVSSVSFPQPNSTTALVVPLNGSIDPENRWLYSYDILSLGEYNYTVVYDLDKNLFSYNILILSFDPPQEKVVRDEHAYRGNDEYLEYVRNGGRLVVLNTNGYGYFASRMLDYRNNTIEASMINGSKSIKLPLKIPVPSLYPKEKDVKITCYYTSPQGSSVYAFREDLGSGEIVYVNLYPIIEAMKNSQEKSIFYSLLGKLLEPAGIQLERFKYINPPLTATFKEVEMSGRIWISTLSLLFPINVNFEKVKVVDRDGEISLLTNVTGLQLSNYNNVSIISSNLILSKGKGFYSNLMFKNNVTMMFSGNITLVTENRKILKLDHVRTIIINSDKISLYAFEPVITLQGTASFKELYSSGTIISKTRTYGQDLKVDGAVMLKMYLSDAYSWASSFNLSGRFERSPPILSYDELASLSQAIFWIVILVPIFIAFILITYNKKESKFQYE